MNLAFLLLRSTSRTLDTLVKVLDAVNSNNIQFGKFPKVVAFLKRKLTDDEPTKLSLENKLILFGKW